ncbi:uncharacterized protein LOC129591996 [Paramacrobiotus metropolitanus]|uniref:uncharacterized protein LOC129591996 n=1 Tax=Paramacrobiotus metropolitanus TaxID=2943436 RepID=UPI002446312B|nr:uncharacterized protein LOC129591996 [Paramacrobiotus metropolitanus]
MDSSCKFRILVFILTVSVIMISRFRMVTSVPVDPCTNTNQEGTYLAEMLSDACILFDQIREVDNAPYHSIFCNNLSYDDLKNSFRLYKDRPCKLPVKLYIPRLNFLIDQYLFEDVAEYIHTLIIKHWNPFPEANGTRPAKLDLGSPFINMNNLKLLDIAFDYLASFPKIPKEFLDGLNGLEAVLFEHFPSGTVLEQGLFDHVMRTESLQCVGLLGSTIPCSCDNNDPGHWLHTWLHHHQELWGSAGRGFVSYSDRTTSNGDFFLCEVKIKCKVTDLTDSDNPTKIIPFHDFRWKERCTKTTTESITPEILELTHLPVQEHDYHIQNENGEIVVIAQAVRSAAVQMFVPTVMTFIVYGIHHFL